MRSLIRGVGRLALFGASLAFVSGVTLFLIASYLLTWPLHRLSPRNRRLRTIMDLAASVAAVVMAYQPPPDPDEDAPNS